MKNILFIACDFGLLNKMDCGASVRSTLFVKALTKLGHVDVISFNKDKITSNIDNCDVVYSSYVGLPNSQGSQLKEKMSLLKFLIKPLNPYSYYQLNLEREIIVDKQISENKYDIIACRYIEDAISCGLFKYQDRLVIDVDDNPIKAQLRDISMFPSRMPTHRLVKVMRALSLGYMVKRVLSNVKCSFFSNIAEPPNNKSVYLHNTTIVPRRRNLNSDCHRKLNS